MAHSPHPTQWQVPECNQRHPWATNPWHLATPDVESLEEQLQQYLGPSQATKKLATTAGEFVYCTDWCRDDAVKCNSTLGQFDIGLNNFGTRGKVALADATKSKS